MSGSSGSCRSSPPPPLNLASLPPNKFKLDRSNTASSDVASVSTPNSKHSASYSSTASSSFNSTFPSLRKPSASLIKSSPTVNVHTTCGRHTDQLLFSGPSLKDLARSLKKKF